MVPKIFTRTLMVLIAMVFSVVGFAQKDCNTPSTFVANYDLEVTPSGTWSQTATLSIASNGCQVLKVNMTIGQEYTFKTGCGDGATAAFDTRIDVYNSAGTSWITGNDDGCESYRSTVTWTATETVAFVNVRGYNSTQYGTLVVAYKNDAPAPVGDCKTAPDFDYTISVTGSWQTHPASPSTVSLAANECKIYKVTGITPETYYTFKTGCDDGATADFDTWIELYDADGHYLVGTDDACSG